MASQDELLVQGTYNTLYNAITRPDRKFVVSHYFLDEWLPILGPSLAWLIVGLRQRCFWNKRHDWCIVDKATLARDTAMQERTIERCLKKPFSSWFVLDVTHRYRYRTDLGKKVRDKNRYHLLLDDPLSPRHQLGLTALLRQIIPTDMDPIDAALVTLQNLLDLARLNDKISHRGQVDRSAPRRTVLELVEEILEIDLVDYAADERIALLDHSCSQLHNKIVQPNKIYVGWQYFRLHWLQHLGHALAWLIIYLRRRCFWDENSGELREECALFKKNLAAAIGQTPRNLANLMDNRHNSLFFTTPATVEPAGGSEVGQKAPRKGPTLYRVRLVDEPLTPEDQRRVAVDLRQRLQGPAYGVDQEDGQLNLFPIFDRASNRQNFAYGQVAAEDLPGRSEKKSRLDKEIAEDLPGRYEEKGGTGDRRGEDLPGRSGRGGQPDHQEADKMRGRGERFGREDEAEAEDLPGRYEKKGRLDKGAAEDLPGRWPAKSRSSTAEAEEMPGRNRKKGRLDDREAEKMSQHEQAGSGKNVATLKDSLVLLKTKKESQQKPNAAAALGTLQEELEKLSIQEPTRSGLLANPTITAVGVRAWALYAETQPGLKNRASYVIKRLQANDTPPAEFLTFARLDDTTWTLFEQVAQALYFGQPVTVEIDPELLGLFMEWSRIYTDLDPTEIRQWLSRGRGSWTQEGEPAAEVIQPVIEPSREIEWARQAWGATLDQLRLKMTKSTFDAWLRRTTVVDYQEGTLIVGVQNDYAKEWLENRLFEIIERVLNGVVGEAVRPIQVEFIVQNRLEASAR